MPDLDGIGLQLYINEIFPKLAQEEWEPDIWAAVTGAHCEVDDHGRGLVSFALVRNSCAIATDRLAVIEGVRWPAIDTRPAGYDPIRDRTPAGIETTIRAHLRYMEPQIRMAMQRRGAV